MSHKKKPKPQPVQAPLEPIDPDRIHGSDFDSVRIHPPVVSIPPAPMKTSDLAQRYGVSEATVRRWIREGRIAYALHGSGNVIATSEQH